MSEEKIKNEKNKYEYGTNEYFKLSLRDMVNSVWCYNNYSSNYDKYLENKYITNYYEDTNYCNGKARLTKQEVEEIVKSQVDYLEKHCKVIRNIGTDNEGVTYNSIVEKESEVKNDLYDS